MYNLLSLVLLRLDEPSYYSLAPSIGRTSSTTTYHSDGSHKEKNPLFAAKPRFRELWGKEKKEEEEERREVTSSLRYHGEDKHRDEVDT